MMSQVDLEHHTSTFFLYPPVDYLIGGYYIYKGIGIILLCTADSVGAFGYPVYCVSSEAATPPTALDGVVHSAFKRIDSVKTM